MIFYSELLLSQKAVFKYAAFFFRRFFSRSIAVFLLIGLIQNGFSSAHHVTRSSSKDKIPFAYMAKTPVDLVNQLIDCLNKGDTARYYRLSITRQEYLSLYRYLPNADTSNSDDLNFRLGFFLMDNRKMVLRAFSHFGNQSLVFSKFGFEGQKEDRGPLFFQHGLKVWVKKSDQEIELPISKSLIFTHGGWKFWGFSSD